MSGILDRKQRLVDFILTSDGYRQIENGDLRFVYATLTDRDAIYDRISNEYNVADITAIPFSFEANSSAFDKINVEIDLKETANFELRTEIDGQYIDLRNNDYQNISVVQQPTVVLDKISNTIIENLVNQRIILTDDFFNLNYNTQQNNQISLYVSKINKEKIDLNNVINTDNLQVNVQIDSLNNYFTLVNPNSLNLSKTSMIEDDRFKNKLNYLFLPPSNMNKDVVTRNNKINNFYNLAEDKRDTHKILFKNFKSNGVITSPILENFKNLGDVSVDTAILESIKILDHDDFNVGKFELMFENSEYDTEFILNLAELNQTDTSNFNFNKLLFINQGEIFDTDIQKNVQVYSVGKLLNSKAEIDLDNISTNNLDNGQYIIEDNYLFINLFTIVIE